MLTVILRAAPHEVRKHLDGRLPQAVITAVGRLTAVQSPYLDRMGIDRVREVVSFYRLPVVKIDDRPPFSETPSEGAALALPPARGR